MHAYIAQNHSPFLGDLSNCPEKMTGREGQKRPHPLSSGSLEVRHMEIMQQHGEEGTLQSNCQ